MSFSICQKIHQLNICNQILQLVIYGNICFPSLHDYYGQERGTSRAQRPQQPFPKSRCTRHVKVMLHTWGYFHLRWALFSTVHNFNNYIERLWGCEETSCYCWQCWQYLRMAVSSLANNASFPCKKASIIIFFYFLKLAISSFTS